MNHLSKFEFMGNTWFVKPCTNVGWYILVRKGNTYLTWKYLIQNLHLYADLVQLEAPLMRKIHEIRSEEAREAFRPHDL